MFPFGKRDRAIREHETEPVGAFSESTTGATDTVILVADVAGLFECFPNGGGPWAIIDILRMTLGETPYIGIRSTEK